MASPPAALADPEACATRQVIAAEIETIHEQIQRVAGRPDATKALAPRLKALERRLEVWSTLQSSQANLLWGKAIA